MKIFIKVLSLTVCLVMLSSLFGCNEKRGYDPDAIMIRSVSYANFEALLDTTENIIYGTVVKTKDIKKQKKFLNVLR